MLGIRDFIRIAWPASSIFSEEAVLRQSFADMTTTTQHTINEQIIVSERNKTWKQRMSEK
jgi:hypothetical protein